MASASPLHLTDKGSAAHVIAGFRYQLLQSLATLIGLSGEETLHLEVSEDFSVAAKSGSTDHQVKNSQAISGPPPFSLQSSHVRDCIARFWEASRSVSIERRLVFIARGGAALERQFQFPDGQPGLRYWALAALDADTAPMRAALLALFEGDPLGEWLASEPDDEELRNRLLRRVDWQLESASAGELAVQIKDQLRPRFSALGLPVTLADTATKLLIAQLFEVASRPLASERSLGRLDLQETIERLAADAYLAGRTLHQPAVATDPNADGGILFSELDPVPPSASRSETVDRILEDGKGQPIIWLHGAHGVGKSTLARLVAHRSGGNWLVADLWPVKDDQVSALAAWRALLAQVAQEDFHGIIIDDFVGDAARVLTPRLATLARTISKRGVKLIVTSHHVPSPAQLSDAGCDGKASVQAPYFSLDDIVELVRRAPSPAAEIIEGWAGLIHVTTRGGHPVLAIAKLASLRARNWPDEALLEDFGSTPSEAMKLTREDARRELLTTLRDIDETRSLEAGQLLRRAAAIYDQADDALLLKLASAEPPLRNAGDIIALLKGAWLEVLPHDAVRVSPLISDIVSDVPASDLKAWRGIAAIHWIKSRKLNERTLPLCFWNAYWGEQDYVLLKVCETVITMEEDKLRSAAPILGTLTFLKTDQPIYPSSPIVGLYLRALQFLVAAAVDKPDIAGATARRFLDEAEALGEPGMLMIVSAAPRMIMSSTADIDPGLRMRLVLALRESLPQYAEFLGEDPLAKFELPPEFSPEMDLADFLFTTIVRHIKGADDQLEVFQVLDQQCPDVRNRFLDALNAVYGDPSVFVHSGWSRDQIEERDMADALVAYDKIGIVVASWNRQDVVAEIYCARSVILDEGLDRGERALTLIDDAVAELGELPTLLRQRGKLLGRLGRHDEAADILLGLENTIDDTSPFDRGLLFNHTAVAAAKAGQFDEAARLFGKAHDEFLSNPDHLPIAIGVLVERGLALWCAGRPEEAILTAAAALDAVEPVDPQASRQSEQAHQFARAFVGVMFGGATPETLPFPFGQASHLQLSSSALVGVELTPLADNWRILAAVEITCGLNVGIEKRSMSKQTGSFNLVVEKLLLALRYDKCVRCAPAQSTLRIGLDLLGAHNIASRSTNPVAERVKPGELSIERPEKFLLLPDVSRAVQSMILDQLVAITLEPFQQDRLVSLRHEVRAIFGEMAALEALLDAASQEFSTTPDTPFENVLASGIAISPGDVAASPSRRFVRDVTLVVHASRSIARSAIERDVATLVMNGWNSVIEDQRFLLRNPSHAASAIEVASAGGPVRLASAARSLIILRNTVSHLFPASWFDTLAAIKDR